MAEHAQTTEDMNAYILGDRTFEDLQQIANVLSASGHLSLAGYSDMGFNMDLSKAYLISTIYQKAYIDQIHNAAIATKAASKFLYTSPLQRGIISGLKPAVQNALSSHGLLQTTSGQ